MSSTGRNDTDSAINQSNVRNELLLGVRAVTISSRYQCDAGAVYSEWQLQAMEALGAEAARRFRSLVNCRALSVMALMRQLKVVATRP
jgi:hypothetical protein